MNRIFAVAKLSILELFRKKDVYVAVVLSLVVAVPLAAVNAFGVEGAVRYVREVTLLLVWAFSVVVCVTTSARQIPGEIQRRTILPLLTKPVSRGEIIMGKILGSVLASWGAMALFYLGYVILSGLKSGIWIEPVLLQGMLLHACFALLLCSMTVFASLFLTPSATIACSLLVAFGSLLFGDKLPVLVDRTVGIAKYPLIFLEYVLPRFELFDMRLRIIHSWEAISFPVILLLVVYALGYSAVFMFFASLLFNRKNY